MDINEASLKMHYELGGKIEVVSRKKIETREDLSLAYTPGVGRAVPASSPRTTSSPLS